jgi:hypothetical protein
VPGKLIETQTRTAAQKYENSSLGAYCFASQNGRFKFSGSLEPQQKTKWTRPTRGRTAKLLGARSMKLPDLFSVISANFYVEFCSTLKGQSLTENYYEIESLV